MKTTNVIYSQVRDVRPLNKPGDTYVIAFDVNCLSSKSTYFTVSFKKIGIEYTNVQQQTIAEVW